MVRESAKYHGMFDLTLINGDAADLLLHEMQFGKNRLVELKVNEDLSQSLYHGYSTLNESTRFSHGDKRMKIRDTSHGLKTRESKQCLEQNSNTPSLEDMESSVHGAETRKPIYQARTFKFRQHKDDTSLQSSDAVRAKEEYYLKRNSRRNMLNGVSASSLYDYSSDDDSREAEALIEFEPPHSYIKPVCIRLPMRVNLERGDWCRPGRVVGLFRDGENVLVPFSQVHG
jgi:hypothetical protein